MMVEANLPLRLADRLYEGTLLRRYKRFLADVRLTDGAVITVHCPNPGSMLGLSEAGSRVLLRYSDNPRRKLAFTMVVVFAGAVPVNVDTQLPNRIVYQALRDGRIPELCGYDRLEREVPFADSRFDLCLYGKAQAGGKDCFVEIKSTTLTSGGVAMFPDAPTARGRKHLATLARAVRAGRRAIQFYLISRNDTSSFRPADEIDAQYGAALRRAIREGVEVMAWDVRIYQHGLYWLIDLNREVPVDLPL